MDDSKDAVLLSWQMPRMRRILFWAIPLGIVLIIMVAVAILTAKFLSVFWIRFLVLWIPFVAYGFLYWLVYRPCFLAVKDIRVTGSGVNARLLTGKIHPLPWEKIQALKHTRLGFTVLAVNIAPDTLYLYLPKPVVEQLISVIRESSDARIVGFDQEVGSEPMSQP